MVNYYQDLRKLVNEMSLFARASQEVLKTGANLYSKNLVAGLLVEEGTENERDYLLHQGSDEELYKFLTTATEQKETEIQEKINRNLEKILQDAPDKITDFAAKNVKPSKIGNERHDKTARTHEKYRDLRETLQSYRTAKNNEEKTEIRKQLTNAINPIYEQRYEDSPEIKELMKDFAEVSDNFLIREYKALIRQAKEEFENQLGNRVSYLYENVKRLEDDSDFIGFLITGDKKQLVKTAMENGDDLGVDILSEDIQGDEIANMSLEKARQIMLRNYEDAQEYTEGDFVISRNSGIQAQEMAVPLM